MDRIICGKWMMRLIMVAVCLESSIFNFQLSMTFAQPNWTKKASKAVFSLKTFDDQGTLIGSATGFFVTDDGVALSSYAPFKGASRAVVIDAGGKEQPVTYILGANETYDVARFQVSASKTQPLTVAKDIAPAETAVWLLPYREVKSIPTGIISKAETFNDSYGYYTVSLTMPDNTVGAPLLNEAGEVIGLMQQPYNQTTNDPNDQTTNSYAVSALFADSLRISGLSINDPVLRAINIKKGLPDEIEQALRRPHQRLH
jgi:hypothetical protein